jgi:ABC-type bacteriocin/lantibiotic exporter with double-glycine peptidase domain
MVLEYLGQPMAYDELLRLLDTRPFGTVTHNVLRLTRLGFSVTYREGTLDELRIQLDQRQPVITLVKTGELPYWSYDTMHSIVLVGYDQSCLYANDPHFAQSPQAIPIGDFDLAWLEMGNRYVIIALAAKQ